MTLHDPAVLSGLFFAVGVAGFLASVANYTHAVSPRSPAEQPDNRVRHFWAACYFGGILLMGMAYFAGWGPSPAAGVVWLSLCGAGWSCTHAAKLGRMYLKARGGRREPELPLYRRLACFWLIVGVTAGAPFVVAGCQTNPAYSPQEKAVVLAERALKANFETIDSFLTFDDENRAWMRLKLPAVHAFAETLRKPGPDGVQAVVAAQRAAWRAHDAWSAAPTTANAAAFDVAAEQVRAWAQQARKYLETSR